ncbi:hypothetical protein HHL16_08655 [Pseudoflavitalea sp. G-6-1-2]|uniref:IPT/TIG domain-containing protein n=1 Tax=Pseudoflavitalea sp. G-6-1-2 TaxID=2728841 RepID=UPI00146E5CD6|nr:IPT/TIG domain-containing protein [Pseudoflavitalea sp. G-6-1-2]NML20942.1 hypothetical protein [Pseudoflavitalea sp. G-6-1-2]
MRQSKKWWILLPAMLLALVTLVISGCKKNDKLPPLQIEIKSYYPNSGQAGTLVTIEGTGFVTNINQYKADIGGTEVEVISATDKALVVRMPGAGKTGKLNIKIEDKTYAVGDFSYQTLTLTKLFPVNGSAGSQVRISGAGFSSVSEPAAVYFNGVKALIVSAADTVLVAEVPKDAGSGPVVVKVNGMEVKGQHFKYQSVLGIKPMSGGANTRVVIKGSGFESTLDGNLVDFNGKPTPVISATETELVVAAPAGVETGAVSVTINGQQFSGPAFTVVPKPVLGLITPLSGPKGTEMIINGDIFSTEKDENKVFINNTEVPVTSATKNQLKLILPGGTGNGLIKVVVNDQATDGPQFKDQTLGISSMTPENGFGGTTVTITGTGFSPVLSDNIVTFNGLPAILKSVTEITLVVETPAALTSGEVKVKVGAQEAVAPQIFRRAGVKTLIGGPNSDQLGLNPGDMALDSHDNIYVTDPNNNRVVKITPQGVMSVLQANGADIYFQGPSGITIDKNDNIYVSDSRTNEIRKITPSGQNLLYASGFMPANIQIDHNTGLLYANDKNNNSGMYKISTSGTVTKVAGPAWVRARMAIDGAGNVYYADENRTSGNAVMKVTPSGSSFALAGSSDIGYQDGAGYEALFYGINSIIFSNPGELLVADRNNQAIRAVEVATGKVTTLAKFKVGYADGILQDARFGEIADLAVAKDGSIIVVDSRNKAVRKIFLQ